MIGHRSRMVSGLVKIAAAAGAIAFAVPSSAAQQGPIIQLPGLSVRGDSTSITIIVLLTLLTLLPALLMSVTPLVRILVIFHFLRQALGTQTTPTNQTLIGLGIFLTYFIMQPGVLSIHQQAIVPFENVRMTPLQAPDAGSSPLRTFILEYTREKALALFLQICL